MGDNPYGKQQRNIKRKLKRLKKEKKSERFDDREKRRLRNKNDGWPLDYEPIEDS